MVVVVVGSYLVVIVADGPLTWSGVDVDGWIIGMYGELNRGGQCDWLERLEMAS